MLITQKQQSKGWYNGGMKIEDLKEKQTRQGYWKEKGYTQEQINVHLSFERRKAKEARERKKKNNEKNKDIIKRVKSDLLNKTFETGQKSATILSINPTVDGTGFWFKAEKTFSDGSSGTFREYHSFDDYNHIEFVKYLFL